MLNYIPKPKRIDNLIVCADCGDEVQMVFTEKDETEFECRKCELVVETTTRKVWDAVNRPR